ncbi:hypothetical protein XENOCAPTIV_002979, partial [Xenoophorus captivus]
TSSSGLKYRGTIDVPNLSDENDEDDLDVSQTLTYNHCSLKVPDQRIEMRWRFRTWPNGESLCFDVFTAAASRTLQHLSFLVPPLDHYATISLELVDRGDATELKLECRGVPAGEEETTREGWNRFYFQAIKQTFGY